jgi:hypothetical protein
LISWALRIGSAIFALVMTSSCWRKVQQPNYN